MRVFMSLALSATCLLAPAVRAQSAQRWSLQVSALSVGASGEAYDGLSTGAGLEAQVRLTPSVWSVGLGFQGSSHTLAIPGSSDETVTLAGVFIEPRRVIDVGSSTFAPYVSARLSYLQQSIDLDVSGTTVTASASGTQVNGGGGVLFRLSPRVNLDLGATYGLINFGDVEVAIPGSGTTSIDGSSGSGSNLVLRVGLAIGLGKK